MKRLLCALTALSLSMPAMAQKQAPMAEPAMAMDSTDGSSCTVSSDGKNTVIDVAMRLKVWQLMQGQTGSQAMRFNITPAGGGKPPIVTYHAINSKGTGLNNGRVNVGLQQAGSAMTGVEGAASNGGDASNPDSKKKLGDCVMGTHFKDAKTASEKHKDEIDVLSWSWRCNLSGDPADPALTVHITTPASDKVVVGDLYLSDLKNCA
jgi:hypothetical protein